MWKREKNIGNERKGLRQWVCLIKSALEKDLKTKMCLIKCALDRWVKAECDAYT